MVVNSYIATKSMVGIDDNLDELIEHEHSALKFDEEQASNKKRLASFDSNNHNTMNSLGSNQSSLVKGIGGIKKLGGAR